MNANLNSKTSKGNKSQLAENLISANINSVLQDLGAHPSNEDIQSVKRNESNNDEIDLNEINVDEFFGSQLKMTQDIQRSIPKEIVRPHTSKYKIACQEEVNFVPVFEEKPIMKNEAVEVGSIQNNKMNINPLSMINTFSKGNSANNEMLKNLCHGFVDVFFSQKEELDNLKKEYQKLQYMMLMNNKNNVNDTSMNCYTSQKKKKQIPYEVKNEELFSITKVAKKEEDDTEETSSMTNNRNKSKKQLEQIFLKNPSEIIPEVDEHTTEKKSNDDKNVQIFQEIKITTHKKSKPKEEFEEDNNVIIDLSKIQDDEFDTMLDKLKKNKKSSLPSSKDPFKKSSYYQDVSSIQSKKKKSFDPKSNSKKKLIQSDFMAGGKPVAFKPNSKTIKLMREMEQDVDIIEDIDVSPNNTKINRILPKKRNFNESMKGAQINPLTVDSNNNRQKTMKRPSYKIDKPTTKDKSLNKLVTLKSIDFLNTNLNFSSISNVEYYCPCYLDNNAASYKCKICQGKGIISFVNCHIGFYYYMVEYSPKGIFDTSDSMFQLVVSQIPLKSNNKQYEFYNTINSFIKYQFQFLSFKYYLLSRLKKESLDTFQKSIKIIFAKLALKFKKAILEGKRSFITKVAEKDASINTNMILQIVNIKTNQGETDYQIELTDGYKSVFSAFDSSNPISGLIKSKKLYIGMKLNIGLAKIVNITETFDVNISIFYNAISKAKITDRLGPVAENKFIIKNLNNLRNDGGEISMINVIILKKYEYYINDIGNQIKYSKKKYEQLMEDYREKSSGEEVAVKKRKSLSEHTKHDIDKEEVENFTPPENILFHFRLLCADAMLYYNLIQKGGYNQGIINKLLKKKCYIDFAVKSFGKYEEISTGIYRIMLLNNTKNNFTGFNNGVLSFKANDSTMIAEEKIANDYKKDPLYKDLISSTLKTNFNIKNDIDLCNYLVQEQFQYDSILNQEMIFCGLFLKKLKRAKNNPSKNSKNDGGSIKEKEETILFFRGLHSFSIILKLHSASFFDLSKFVVNNHISKIKGGMNKLCIWSNVILKSICYYDNSIKQLVSLNSDKFNKKNPNDYINLIICLETSFYSDYQMATRAGESKFDLKEGDEDKIKQILNCI